MNKLKHRATDTKVAKERQILFPLRFLRPLRATLTLACLVALPVWADTHSSDGSASDVQTKINAAADGDVVTIPAGTFTWASGATISGKGIHLQGAGAGGFKGYSRTSLAIGTGSKTFTTQSGLTFSAGQTVRAHYTAYGTANYMQGTVTSYSGTTLVLNVTSVTGSGTYADWVLAIAPTTIIVHNGSGTCVALTEDASDVVEVSGICFWQGTGTYSQMSVTPVSNGKPVQIHDCWFSTPQAMQYTIQVLCNRGLVYQCSFDGKMESYVPPTYYGLGSQPLTLALKHNQTASWTTGSSMGTADAAGTNNVYVEDCWFVGLYLKAWDLDDNARACIRYNTFYNSGGGSHGVDTSNDGGRHLQLYKNSFLFSNLGNNETYNINWWYLMRGGTAIICSNQFDNIASSTWGDKSEIELGCYGAQLTGRCFTTWPGDHQVGRGYITGENDSEIAVLFDNTGTVEFGYSNPGDACGNGLSSADFVQLNRDYALTRTNWSTNWVAYAYPHPLRTDQIATNPPSILVDPSSLVRTNGQSATFTVTATGSEPLAYQWQKDTANIAAATTYQYTIASVTNDDAGSFQCVVTNANGSITSGVATLTVYNAATPPSTNAGACVFVHGTFDKLYIKP